ncbi:MAG: DUF4340 domain-containing protein [Oscillospiraceae bacterium]|nr:DUF4340 domain-containing protein [Oscillospiraceae bacterium]
MSDEQKQSGYVADNENAEADTIFGSAPEQKQTSQKKGPSRSIRNLLIAVCLAVVVGAGLTAVLLVNRASAPDSGQTDTTDPAAENIKLNDADELNVKEVDIKGDSPFHVTRTVKGREDAPSEYVIEGFEGLALDDALLSTLAYNGSIFEAERLIEEQPDDLSRYGLAQPRADVTMSYDDGSQFRFQIGMDSPTESGKVYCAVDGNVYLIRNSLVANYCRTPEDYLSKTILPALAEGEVVIVKNLRVSREDLDEDIVLEYDEAAAESSDVGGTAATHIMTEPIFTYLNVEKSKDITNGMFGLTAQEVAVIHPEDADFARTGLDAPFCTVEMETGDGNKRVLTFGHSYQTDDGTTLYYMHLEGLDEIFGVSADNAKWLTFRPGDISSSNIFVTNVWNIGTLDITDKTHDFRFVGEGNKDNYTVTLNGKECDKERYRTLYRFLLYIYGEELYLGELPDGEPDAEVHLTTQNGKEDYTISFYRVSDLRTIVARDGQPGYVIRSSALDTLSYNLGIFDDTEKDFKTSWQ